VEGGTAAEIYSQPQHGHALGLIETIPDPVVERRKANSGIVR
jgi:ABC-type dipeptide/oligopeptide/nickel transport system ATPase component